MMKAKKNRRRLQMEGQRSVELGNMGPGKSMEKKLKEIGSGIRQRRTCQASKELGRRW